MSNKYRIYCNDDSHKGFQYIWSDLPPTVCPVDENHNVNINSIKKVSHASPLYVFPTGNTIGWKSKYYQKILSFPYDPRKNGDIRFIKFSGKMDSKLNSYNVEIFLHKDGKTVVEGIFTNTETAINAIAIPKLPDDEVLIDINVKINGKKDKVYIDTVMIYVEVDD